MYVHQLYLTVEVVINYASNVVWRESDCTRYRQTLLRKLNYFSNLVLSSIYLSTLDSFPSELCSFLGLTKMLQAVANCKVFWTRFDSVNLINNANQSCACNLHWNWFQTIKSDWPSIYHNESKNTSSKIFIHNKNL